MALSRWWQRVLLAVCLASIMSAVSVVGQEKTGPSLDKRVYDVLKTVINTGADLYNQKVEEDDVIRREQQTENNRLACYRLYHGALLTVYPFLEGYPQLQKQIDEGLSRAEKERSAGEKAFVLRGVLDEIRSTILNTNIAKIKERKTEMAPKPGKATGLWDRLGGEKTVSKVVDELVSKAATDPKVNFSRGGKIKLTNEAVASLKGKLVAFLSELCEGPLPYRGQSMKLAHKDMGITDDEFDAFARILRQALEDNGVKPNDIQELLRLVEGTRADIVETKGPSIEDMRKEIQRREQKLKSKVPAVKGV